VLGRFAATSADAAAAVVQQAGNGVYCTAAGAHSAAAGALRTFRPPVLAGY